MRQDMLSANLPEPEFSTEGFFTVTLSRHKQEALSSIINNTRSANKTQQAIINYIGTNDGVTPADIISATGIKKTAVYSHLQKMNQAKMIVKNEEGEWIIRKP